MWRKDCKLFINIRQEFWPENRFLHVSFYRHSGSDRPYIFCVLFFFVSIFFFPQDTMSPSNPPLIPLRSLRNRVENCFFPFPDTEWLEWIFLFISLLSKTWGRSYKWCGRKEGADLCFAKSGYKETELAPWNVFNRVFLSLLLSVKPLHSYPGCQYTFDMKRLMV